MHEVSKMFGIYQAARERRLLTGALALILVAAAFSAVRPAIAQAGMDDKVDCTWGFASRWGGTTIGGSQVEIQISQCGATSSEYSYHLAAVLTGPGSYRTVVYDGDGTDCRGPMSNCFVVGSASKPYVIANLSAGAWTLTMADTYTYTDPDQGVGHGKTVATAHIPDLAPAPTSVLARPPTPRPSATSRPRPISTASQRPTASRSAPESGIRTASPSPMAHIVSSTPTSSPSYQATTFPSGSPSNLAHRVSLAADGAGGRTSPLALALLVVALFLLTVRMVAIVGLRRRRYRHRRI